MDEDVPAPDVTVLLPDGRQLAADDVGDRGGDVVVYLHGAPDCRLARHPDDGIASALGIRLVAVDRPGYGCSDPDPDALLASFGVDLGHLLDELDVVRCRLVGWSAGATWALAAASILADRVEAVTTFGAVAPFAALAEGDPAVDAASGPRVDLAAAVRSGELRLDELADDVARRIVPTPPVPLELAAEVLEESLGRRSRAELASVPGALDQMARSLSAAVDLHGDQGVRTDISVQYSDREHDLLVGARCPVRLVHGELDPICGPAVGEWYAARLADGTAETWPGLSHHGLFPRWADLLAP